MSRLALIALLAVGFGCAKPSAQKPAASQAAGAAKVSIVAPQKKALVRLVEQPGTVRAYEETPLVAHLTGYVQKVHVDIGARVKGPRFDAGGVETEPGQLLAEIAVPELDEEAKQKQALVRHGEAEIEQARRGFLTAEAGVSAAEAMVKEAQAGLAKAQAGFDRWQSESKRIGGLVRGGVMDRQAQDEMDNQFRSAGAGRDEAQARVASAEALTRKSRAEQGKAGADVKAAEARLEVLKADARRHEATRRYAKIRAPFDGVVTRRGVDTGHYLQPGKSEPLFVVAREGRVRVSVEVPEADAALVKDGAKASVTVPSLRGAPLTGTVSRSAWGLDAGSRTLRVEIDLENADGRLRPAMYVAARISSVLPEAYTLPAAALMKQGEATVLFRVENGKAVRTSVQVGVTAGDSWQILKWQRPGGTWGDFDGGEAIASPAASLADGQAVEASPATK